jgi:hypothetical protein
LKQDFSDVPLGKYCFVPGATFTMTIQSKNYENTQYNNDSLANVIHKGASEGLSVNVRSRLAG